MRWVIAALVVVGLAVGVVLAWPSGTDSPPVTLADAATTTSTSLPPDTTTSVADTTTTADDGETSHVVETVEEAEEILRELWFGWFEGIYNEDEDRIREVVVLEETVDTAQQSFGSDFSAEPEPDDISFEETEILRSDDECLAIWTEMVLEGFREGRSGSVHVLRMAEGDWQRLSLWRFREDLWAADCESQLPSS